jgi:hypothetical protein
MAMFLDDTTRLFVVDLTSLNNSGFRGAAVLTLTDHSLTVNIDAAGLEPGQHLLDVDGFANGAASHPPTLQQDIDRDGFIERDEGQTAYGSVLLNLDNNSDDLGLNVNQEPVADANGNFRYQQTFNFDPSDPTATAIFDAISPLESREIVIRGESVAAGSGAGSPGEIDGTLGYKAVLPVAAGELHEASGASALAAIANFQLFDQNLSNAGTVGNHALGGGAQNDNVHVFTTDFLALNNSGVIGGAVVTVDGHTITFDIAASGLEPGQHLQQIDGFGNGADSHAPTLPQDTDHDGFVEFLEGQSTYGPVLLNLDNNPSDLGLNPAQVPVADANGNLVYRTTFNFDPQDSTAAAVFDSLNPFESREIVIHGETVADGSGAGTPGEVDGTLGFKAGLPVAAGELHEVNGLGLIAALSNFQAFEQSLSSGQINHELNTLAMSANASPDIIG